MAEFKEEDHPRDEDGKFTSSGEGSKEPSQALKNYAGKNAYKYESAKESEDKEEDNKKTKLDKYIEWQKQKHQKQMDSFFSGGWYKQSNKYIRFKHAINDDEIIVATNNVKTIKGNPVLITGSNQAVYLKDWQMKYAQTWDSDGQQMYGAWLIKLNRKFFKPYTFKSDFQNYIGYKPETFDDWLKTAKAQDEADVRWSIKAN